MANPFIKSFLFISIISNFFLYINCEDYDMPCEKMITNRFLFLGRVIIEFFTIHYYLDDGEKLIKMEQ